MKTSTIVVSALIILSACGQELPEPSAVAALGEGSDALHSAEDRIRAATANIDAAYNNRDVAQLGSELRTDGYVIDVYGNELDRNGYIAEMQQLWAMYPGTQRKTTVDRMRRVDDSTVVEDASVVMQAPNFPDINFHATSVWTKVSGQWKVIDCRVFVFLTPS